MRKEKTKPVVMAILSATFVAISAMGLVACEKAPESFVCPETNLTLELSYDQSHYVVTNCPTDKTELVIKESYYKKPVKSIEKDTFKDCIRLKKLSIPDCMTYISDGALDYCRNLEYNEASGCKYLGNESRPYLYLLKPCSSDIEELTVESECKIIGSQAFLGCASLTCVTAQGKLEQIQALAFQNCDALKSVSLNGGVESIRESAFYDCDVLESVIIQGGLKEIRNRAFSSCGKLKNITLPEGLTSIGVGAFYECAFESVELPNTLTTIDSSAFNHCQSLKSITIPDSVTKIGEMAFSCCGRLKTLKLGKGVTNISYQAFAETGLTSLVIPEWVDHLWGSAFYGSDIESVVIPVSVKVIGPEAFAYCSKLAKIEYNGTKAQWEKVKKNNMWDWKIRAKEVVCKDGTVNINSLDKLN